MASQGTKDCAVEQMFVEGGLVGLTNIGNTCYMNSMLQCLSHTLEMTQAFLRPHFHNDKPLVGGKYMNDSIKQCSTIQSLFQGIKRLFPLDHHHVTDMYKVVSEFWSS